MTRIQMEGSMNVNDALAEIEKYSAVAACRQGDSSHSKMSSRKAYEAMREMGELVPELVAIIVEEQDVQSSINTQWHVVGGLHEELAQVVIDSGIPHEMFRLLRHTKANEGKLCNVASKVISAIVDSGDADACLDVMIHVIGKPHRQLMEKFLDVVKCEIPTEVSSERQGRWTDEHRHQRERATAWLIGCASKTGSANVDKKSTETKRAPMPSQRSKRGYSSGVNA